MTSLKEILTSLAYHLATPAHPLITPAYNLLTPTYHLTTLTSLGTSLISQVTSLAPKMTSRVLKLGLKRWSSKNWKRGFLLLFTFFAISQLPVDRFWIFFYVFISTSNFRNSGKIRILPSLMHREWEPIKDCSSWCKNNNNHYHSYFQRQAVFGQT